MSDTSSYVGAEIRDDAIKIDEDASPALLTFEKGFARTPANPTLLYSSIDAESTFPVIATIGIRTPASRSSVNTCSSGTRNQQQ